MDKVTCKTCGAQFDSEDELMKHNDEAHAMEGEMKCPMCGVGFKSQDELDAHTKKAHSKM